MVDPLSDWWVHFIEVERPEGEGAYGTSFGQMEVVKGFFDDTRKYIRSSTGAEVLSSARVMLPHGTAEIPPGSLVRGPTSMGGTRKRKVISASVREAGALDVPQHVELYLE